MAMSSFKGREYRRAAAWKSVTATLPEPGRAAAAFHSRRPRTAGGRTPLPFCLPIEYAGHNLLPEVREPMVELFAELGIPWHEGIDGGPGNHLLSSQVQCANALGQTVTDPDRLVAAFGALLDIGEVLEIEPGRFLTFEYIGDTDYFGEAVHGECTRGARCTSVDAAFLHRAEDGKVELVLVEWKYVESYRVREPDLAEEPTRRSRYQAAIDDPDGPIRNDVVPMEQLFVEPIYQLVRQQLLAHHLEREGAHGAERVRVVHVCPPENFEYQQSLTAAHRAAGSPVNEVWQRLLRTARRGSVAVNVATEALVRRPRATDGVDPDSIETHTDRDRSSGPGRGQRAPGPDDPSLHIYPSLISRRRRRPRHPADLDAHG